MSISIYVYNPLRRQCQELLISTLHKYHQQKPIPIDTNKQQRFIHIHDEGGYHTHGLLVSSTQPGACGSRCCTFVCILHRFSLATLTNGRCVSRAPPALLTEVTRRRHRVSRALVTAGTFVRATVSLLAVAAETSTSTALYVLTQSL